MSAGSPGVPHPPLPQCKALLLCDQTIVEAVTGKISIIGVIDRFVLREMPARLRQFQAFMQITDAVGRYDLVVEIQDLQVDEVIARAPGSGIQVPDQLAKVNIIIPVPPILLTHAGAYDFVVFANGHEIERQKFLVIEVPNATG